MMESLYIHIPFCEKICTYCDFAKEVDSQVKKEKYVHALIKELSMHREKLSELQTIFIGGGTPSVLTISQLTTLGNALHKVIKMYNIKEFTIECNPSDINEEKALKLIDIGVNRISLGVQTFNDNHLKFLNRTHRLKDIESAVSILRKVGFRNISVDLLFGLPNQNMAELRDDVRRVLAMNVEHISYYNLILEEGTKLYNLVQNGEVDLLDNDIEANMYEWIITTLSKQQFDHYEISNFAKPNYEGYHNVLIWKDADYLGIGVGAHSKYNNTRYANTSRLKYYMESIENNAFPKYETYPYEPMRDYLLNGLRLREGIDLNSFKHRFGQSVFTFYPGFESLVNSGLLAIDNQRLYLTHQGLMYGNTIFGML